MKRYTLIKMISAEGVNSLLKDKILQCWSSSVSITLHACAFDPKAYSSGLYGSDRKEDHITKMFLKRKNILSSTSDLE